jgi:hypothetical protein
MRLLRAFGQFWWDFLIGDDWKIAATVAATLAVGAVLAAQVEGEATWLAPVLGGALLVAFAAILVLDVRRG